MKIVSYLASLSPVRPFEWLLAGTHTRSPEVQAPLLQHGQLNTLTLITLTLANALMAGTAIVLTGQAWAWAWLVAEILLGCAKFCLQNSINKEIAAGRRPSMAGSVAAGLAGATVIGVAGLLCVASGNSVLILMSGICIGGLVGGTTVRSAGTPRFTVALICLMTLPFALATLLSPIPNLSLIGMQLPLLLIGLVFVLHEDYKNLVGLYRAQHENRWLAHHDILTGLPNRTMELKCFDDLLRQQARDPAEGQSAFTVLCLDLDGFKDVNDGYGHEAGDAVLVAVAQRLKGCIRDIDFLFRVGGDEFVILLPDATADAATAIARRIIDRISKPIDIGHDRVFRIGISIGSAFAPTDGTTADELLRSADQAMYEAKRRGKGIYVKLPAAAGVVELFPEASSVGIPAVGARAVS